MILSILSKAVSGAIVGYTTNDLAVQMLFRKRFGLGGIVLKTHEQFIENISKLVEREIINHHTLSKELDTAEFQQVLEQTIESFFQKALHQIIPQDYLLHYIPRLDESFDHIRKDFISHLDEPTEQILDYVLERVKFKEVVSDVQLKRISHSLSRTFVEQLHISQIATFTTSLYGEIQQQPLKNFVDTATLQLIGNNIAESSQALPSYLKYNYATQIDQLIENVEDVLEFEQIVKQLLDFFLEKPVTHWFNEEELSQLIEVVKSKMTALLHSPKGDLIAETFAKFCLKALRKENATIFELLSDDLEANFSKFLEERLPSALQKLIAFIQQQKIKIDYLIDQTFRDNTRFKLQEWAVKIFAGSVSEKAKVVTRIVEFIEKYDAETLANQAASFLVQFLKKNTIGEIFSKIDDKVFIENIAFLAKNNFVNLLEQLSISNVEKFLKPNLNEWINSEYAYQTAQNLLDNEAKAYLKNNFLYHDNFNRFLQKNIESQIGKLAEVRIEELISPDKIQQYAHFIESSLLQFTKTQQHTIEQFIWQNLHQELDHRYLKDLFSTEKLKNYTPQFYTQLDQYLVKSYKEIKQQPLHHYLEQLNTSAGVYQALAKYLQKATLSNLDILLKGKIESLVKQNLRPLPPERIRDMVEKFMGKEVAPINVLGAFLGGITGAALYAMPTLNNGYLNTALSGLAYGVTGYGTNYLALKMVFKPYKAKYWKGIKLPFTPGIIAKNQGRFASNMGKFVDQSLLNKDSLIKKFDEQKDEIENSLVKFLSENNYDVLHQLNLANLGRSGELLASWALEYFDKHNDLLTQTLSQIIDHNKDFNLSQLDTSQVKYQINQYFLQEDFQKRVEDNIYRFVQSNLQENKALKDILPPTLLKNLKETINGFIEKELQKHNEKLTYRQIEQYLEETLEMPFQKLLGQPINQILTENQNKALLERLGNAITQLLNDKKFQGNLLKTLTKRIEKEINPKKKIGEMLDGQLITFVEKNINSLLEKLVDDGMQWLSRHKKSLADEVYEQAYKENKAAFFYKGVIKETVVELTEQGLPDFFKQKLPLFEKMIAQEVEQLADTPLGSINPSVNKTFLQKRLQNLLSNEDLISSTQKISTILIEYSLLRNELGVFAKPLGMASVEHLTKKFEKPLQTTFQQLKDNVTKGIESKELTTPLASLLHSVAMRYYTPIHLQKLTQHIDQATWYHTIHQLSKPIIQSKAFQEKRKELVYAFLKQIKSKSLADNLDIEVLQKDITATFRQLAQQPDTSELLKKVVMDFTSKNLENLNQKLDVKTKKFLLQTLAEASFITLEQNIHLLLEAIDIKQLVISEIEAMHPQEVEKLFNSFASQYFNQLINYGFGFGVAFGLSIDLLLGWVGSKI